MGFTMFCRAQEKHFMRLVIDFHQLNSVLKHKEYPFWRLTKCLQHICGYVFASVIDLNMGYLSIPLTE